METITVDDITRTFIHNPNKDNLGNFVDAITDEDGKFVSQESSLFDYKDKFPYSMTNDYFIGIIRLIFAFYNSYGGIVVLGVDDKIRTGGHNSISVNIEILNTRIRELSKHSIDVLHMTCGKNETAIDVLIVKKRVANCPPLRLEFSVGKYPIGVTWIRQGHEVLTATSDDIGFLFSPRNEVDTDLEEEIHHSFL